MFRYARCRLCQSLTLVNVPTDLSRYYSGTYYESTLGEERSLAGLRGHLDREASKLDLVASFVAAGRLVEVGPAMGAFCAVAKAAGYEVLALERDDGCCRFLEETLGVTAHKTLVPHEVLATLPECDAIVMFHVIEHVENPRELFVAALNNLRAGGVLVVATPNAAATSLRILKGHCAAVEAPRHLSLLSLRGLDDIASEHGADRVLLTTLDPHSRDTNAFVWTRLAERIAERIAPSGQRGRVTHYLRRALMTIAGPVERRSLRGTSFTAVYQVRPRSFCKSDLQDCRDSKTGMPGCNDYKAD